MQKKNRLKKSLRSITVITLAVALFTSVLSMLSITARADSMEGGSIHTGAADSDHAAYAMSESRFGYLFWLQDNLDSTGSTSSPVVFVNCRDSDDVPKPKMQYGILQGWNILSVSPEVPTSAQSLNNSLGNRFRQHIFTT